MKPTILITGCKGMLGTRLTQTLADSGRIIGVDLDGGDLADPNVCETVVAQAAPDVVINAAAFTRVDDCENPDIYPTAFAANATLPKNLAAQCKARDALLVHISSDYVYDGLKQGPYVETDPVGPQSAYGRTKLAGDEAIAASGCRHLILRTAWLFGHPGHNFIEAILKNASIRERLAVVNDQRGCPTSTVDLADAIQAALSISLTGMYHLACKGEATWYEFARTVCKLCGIDIPIDPITTEQLGLPAPRPKNSVLDCSPFFAATGIAQRPWQQAVQQYLDQRPPAQK